ncbi:MAG: hypothetical protein ACXU9D_25295, partial [Xanthobacteraceae bacterium]
MALAGVIMPGVARFIVTLSAQADVFGVGITSMVGFGAMLGSMLVPPRSATAGSIVPSGGLAGTCGVDSGKAAPLVGGPPGVELHTVVEGLPRGDTGEMVPVVLATTGVGMVPSGVPDIIAVDDGVVVDGVIVVVLPTMDAATVPGTAAGAAAGAATEGAANSADVAAIDATGMVEPGIVDRNDVAGCADSANGAVELAAVDVGAADGTVGAAETDAVVAVVPAMTDVEATGTVGVGGPICPIGVEQVTTVPGVDGSDASGTGANVVSGVPGWVIAENGLGPLSGEDSIVPGVDDRPIAVVPMVETCARLALQPHIRAAAVNNRCRMAMASSVPGLARPHLGVAH